MGIGYQAADFRAFDIPIADRVGLFEEGIEIIRRCWAGDPFTFQGTPLQSPRRASPPGSLPTAIPSPLDWSKHPSGGSPRRPSWPTHLLPDLAPTCRGPCRLVDAYRQAALEAGRQPNVILMRDAWVAETRAQAEETYGPEVLDAYKYYWRNGLAEFRSFTSEAEFNIDAIARDRLILGSPSGMCRRVSPLERRHRSGLLPPAAPPRPLRRPAPPENNGNHRIIRQGGYPPLPLGNRRQGYG